MGTSVILQISDYLFVNPLSLVSFLTFILILYKRIYSSVTTKKPLVPSPWKLPIIGNLHQLGTFPHRSLRSLSDRYGDLMLLHLGNKPTLIVSSAKGAEEILKTHEIAFADRPSSKVTNITMYNAIDVGFAKYGEYLRNVKSITVMNMLNNKKVRSFRKVREEEVGLMVQRLKERTPYMALNLTDSLANLSYNVVCRVAFGRKYEGEEGFGNIREVTGDFTEAMGAFCIGDFVPWLGWVDELGCVLRKARRFAKTTDTFIERIVQEHILRYKKDGESHIVQDFVDVLLEIQRNDPSFQMFTIKALMLDMLLGAVDTIPTLLEWTMSELLVNPRVMKQLSEEVRGFLKGKTIIDEVDLKSMTYLKSVIKEAIRLHPPLPLLFYRESSQDVKVRNYDIAAGTQVIINAWAIHRNPAYWEEPDEFRPERFLNNSVDTKGQDFNWIPFGGGRRGCPGIHYTNAMVELVLANLVAHFNWELSDPMDEDAFTAESPGITVRKRHPLLAVPTPYSITLD